MNAVLAAIPQAFRGVWQRTLYAEPANEPYQQADTTTQVYWLQGKHWHADLRLPANLPDFTGITDLDACNRTQLEWLAGLTAFAGITQIEAERPAGLCKEPYKGLYKGLCIWHRFQDLCPSLERDVGLLSWIDDTFLEERHPSGRYIEHWVKHRAQDCQQLANDAVEEVIHTDEQGQMRWLQIGDHAMAITPRPVAADVSDLFSPISTANDSTLRWRASLCFDYLQRCQDGWKVMVSTQPWRQGKLLSASSFIQGQR